MNTNHQASFTKTEKGYKFPTDVRALTSIELGNLHLQLTEWCTHTMDILGGQEMELSGFESLYEIQLGHATLEHKKTTSEIRGAIPKEMIQASCILGSEALKKQTQNLITRKAIVQRLTNQVKIYEKQLSALSREQSRRESEARLR